MSGLSARRRCPVIGGGCPDVETSVWNHVLWAWGNEAEDTSAHDLVTAVPGSGSQWQKKFFRLSPCFRKEQDAIISAWAGNAVGLSCCAWSLQRKEIMFGVRCLPVPFPPGTFSSASLVLIDAHYDSVPLSIIPQRKRDTNVGILDQKAFWLFFADRRLGEMWQLILKITFPIYAVLLMLAVSTRMFKVTWFNN